MGFSRQEYWSGLPFPSPGDLSNPGIKLEPPVPPALQADSLPLFRPASPTRNSTEKSLGALWSQTLWALTLPVSSSVTLGKTLRLSWAQFSHLQNRRNNNILMEHSFYARTVLSPVHILSHLDLIPTPSSKYHSDPP